MFMVEVIDRKKLEELVNIGEVGKSFRHFTIKFPNCPNKGALEQEALRRAPSRSRYLTIGRTTTVACFAFGKPYRAVVTAYA